MANNNIIIELTGHSNMDSINEDIKKGQDVLEDYQKQMEALTKKEVEGTAAIQRNVREQDRRNKILKDAQKHYASEKKALDSKIEAQKRDIQVLQQNAKAANLLAGSTKSATAQIREIRNALMEMEEEGIVSEEAYQRLGIRAAELTDAMGDLQQRINILASDTKNLDAAMSVGSGIAGAFNTATSTVELFGGELEGLQEAFYKVQAVLSILNGVESVANVLNKDSAAMVVLHAAADNVAAKAKANRAIAEQNFTKTLLKTQAAEGAATIKTVIVTGATKAWAAAQWALNAALYANPLVAIIAGAAALAAGIALLVRRFSAAGQAEADFKKETKELEKIQKEQAISAAKRAYEREQQVKKTSEAEEIALAEAKKRNASEVEMAQIRAKFSKKAADDTEKYAEQEIALNDKQVAKLKILRDKKEIQLNHATKGTKKYKKLQEELAEAEQNYYDAVSKTKDLEAERDEARRKQADDELELLRQQEAMRNQAEQVRIDLMRDGASKEIAQINLNYKEQLKTVQGNSKDEVELRKKLLAKQAKEIADIRKRYALQAKQTAIQEQKNLLTAMSQSSGTESDYAKQIAITKQVTEAEAQLRIDSLDKQTMSEEAYAAEVASIRLQLSADLKRIDDDEVSRKNEIAKKLTEIDVAMAESATRALTGDEGVDGQLAIWENYYEARRAQISENESMEIDAVNRSTATTTEKERMITQIQLNAKKEREDLTREEGDNEIAIREESMRELQRALTMAEDDLNNGGDGRIAKLQARYDAEMALYDEQEGILEQKRALGLIKKQDYEDQLLEITRNRTAAEMTLEQEKTQAIVDGMTQVLQQIQEISNLAFEAIGNNIQAEMDALDAEYTTDVNEARKNADKKYITEEEYEKKKAALQLKQQKMAKAKALTDIGISTAMAIMQTLAQLGATPWGIAMAAVAGTMGAAQLAIAAAKPLAQYEKGRNGGKGEYAIVGEKGPELMYVPQGASIVPNNKLGNQEAWDAYGVPRLSVPELPYISDSTMSITDGRSVLMAIDYDKLGEAVAKSLPKQTPVSVSVDGGGIVVREGNATRKYLNKKYSCAWN